FTNGSDQTNRRQVVVFGWPVFVPPHQRPQQGRSGVVAGHTVALNDLEVASGVWGVGHTFVDDLGGTIGQRTIDFIGVRGDPCQVRGAPVHVSFTLGDIRIGK